MRGHVMRIGDVAPTATSKRTPMALRDQPHPAPVLQTARRAVEP